MALRFVYIFLKSQGRQKNKNKQFKIPFFKRPKIFKAIKGQLVPNQAGPLTQTATPPSWEYLKEFDRRGEKIKEKKVRALTKTRDNLG